MNSEITNCPVCAGWKITWCNVSDCSNSETKALILFVDGKLYCASMCGGANYLQTAALLWLLYERVCLSVRKCVCLFSPAFFPSLCFCFISFFPFRHSADRQTTQPSTHWHHMHTRTQRQVCTCTVHTKCTCRQKQMLTALHRSQCTVTSQLLHFNAPCSFQS